MSDTSGPVELAEAADRLGVHYQTAYRWVRSGRLKAALVGGRYRLDATELDRFAARRAAPRRPSPRRPRRGYGPVSERFTERLVAGDERAVRRGVQDLLDSGVPLTTVIEEVVAPAMVAVGAQWEQGRLDIATEHRASSMTERILAEVLPNPRGRRRGTAVVAALSGDRHSLATLMAVAALREDNWRVEHLGADLPVAELGRRCATGDVDLAVISVTLPRLASQARQVGDLLAGTGVPALVGGPGSSLRSLQLRARAAVVGVPPAVTADGSG